MKTERIMSSLFDTGVRPIIDNHLLDEAKKVRDYGDYWSASSAGYCMRKVIFERLGVPKIEQEGDARKQRVFTAGHLFHDWIQGITKKAGLSIAQELELQDEELMIRGHIDDLVLVDVLKEGVELEMAAKKARQTGATPFKQKLILYDYKTVNSRSFMWAKKNNNEMSYYHKMQLGTYMYMLRKNKGLTTHRSDIDNLLNDFAEARILKIEKENMMMMEQQLFWSDELESEVFDYWNTLNAYWKNKKMPPCTCADHEGGFLAKEAYNGYYFEGEPCSLKYYKQWKAKEPTK